MARTRHRSLVGRGGRRFVSETKAWHTHKHTYRHKMTAHRDLKYKKKIEQIELAAELVDYVLWSDKNNVNQLVTS
jgi:hypothetical protein